jgi:hypothetical protein
MAEKDFDWSEVVDETIIQSVGQIALYENPNGDVVIRQRGIDYDMDNDSVVVVPSRSLDPLIKRLNELKAELE